MAFDFSNYYLDAATQSADAPQKTYDDQIFANCSALQTYLGLDHSIVNGTHTGGRNLSAYTTAGITTAAINVITPGVGVWSLHSGFTNVAGSPEVSKQSYPTMLLCGVKYAASSGLVEAIPVWQIQSATFQGTVAYITGLYGILSPPVVLSCGYRSLDGLTYAFSGKYVYIYSAFPAFNTVVVLDGTKAPIVQPNTFDAGIVGMGYTKSHYNQKQAGLSAAYNALLSDHNSVTGVSTLTPTAPFGDGMINTAMDAADNYTSGSTVVKTLAAHGGLYPAWTFNIVPTSGVVGGSGVQVVVRPGFDNSNVYACITGISGGPMVGEQYTLQSTYYNTTTPTSYPALVVTNPSTIYQSYGVNVDQAQRTALLQLLALYNLEHNWIGGGHKVPLARMPGATTSGSLTGTIVASGSVGTSVKVAIDTASSSAYFYYFPAMTGQVSGCGIVDAGIACDGTSVYLNVTRRTAPTVNDATHNTFNFQVLRINDS